MVKQIFVYNVVKEIDLKFKRVDLHIQSLFTLQSHVFCADQKVYLLFIVNY